MEYSQEEKIKIQIENNNCIISGIKYSKTNSNISTNNNTKTSSLKKFQKNIQNNIEKEISLSISKSSEQDNFNKDLSMVEITEKSIFNSELKNGSFNNKTPDTKKKCKEKKLKKIKEEVVRKLNFDFPNNNISNSKKIKKENKFPLLNKIILDYQHKPNEKKTKNNLVTKRITKKIKINLNFKEINLHKSNSYRKNKYELNVENAKINNNINNNYNLKKKNKISYNNIFNNKNISSKDKINLNIKLRTRQNSERKKNIKKQLKKQLSLTITNKDKYLNDINHNRSKKKYKNLILNSLKRNSFNNFLEIPTKKYNTSLTTVNNSSILKDKRNKQKYQNLLMAKDKIKKKSIKSSNNNPNNSYRNTLSNCKYENINKKHNYFSTYNFCNSLKQTTTIENLNKKESKIKTLKKMLKIFGKELYNPIQSNVNDKEIQNLKLLNIISEHKFKSAQSSLKK